MYICIYIYHTRRGYIDEYLIVQLCIYDYLPYYCTRTHTHTQGSCQHNPQVVVMGTMMRTVMMVKGYGGVILTASVVYQLYVISVHN